MHALVHDRRRSHTANPRRVLMGLEALIALNAFGGGLYGLAGAEGVPPEWLDGTPFDSYVVPSLVLMLVVGGSMAVAFASHVRQRPRADDAAIAAGLVLLGWIAVECIVIPFSWLQPLFAGLGLLVVALAVRARRSSA